MIPGKEKKKIIEKDEFDQKEIKLLNFGHTFGHAIESATSYKINHGISVGLGILVSGHLYRDKKHSESYFRIITACPSERIQILALPKTDKVHRMINFLFERLKEKQYEI